MSSEILSVLEYMEKEKGIPRADMISTIINAIKTAALKGVNSGQELKIEINPKNGQLKAWSVLKVVDSIADPKLQIHVEKAQVFKAGAVIGDTIEKEIDPSYLGRIAAQTARQAIMQRLRAFEKERIYDDFKDSVGDIVSGTVRRRERNDLFIDLGKAEAVMPGKEQVPGEEYAPGERIRCILLEIENSSRGPEIILSRASPKFVRRLFELEVTEIADGTVKIEAFAREPGYRTKIAVTSTDPKVDPVGACVGARGARVKSIVREIILDEKNKRMLVRVVNDDLAVAIGRKGQNARLTSRLVGWRLDIEEFKTTAADPRAQAIGLLTSTFSFDPNIAERLVANGINSPAAFEGVEAADLVGMGFSETEAAGVIAKLSGS